ncbi:MAG TPA: recombinase family protein [Clostridia bacterium]|nr:recombinase family protein [Clostridia bacterium]
MNPKRKTSAVGNHLVRSAVSYARGRSIDEREGHSVSDQQGSIREYATRHDIEVVREFADFNDQRNVTGRPAFLEMVSFLAKHPEVTIILSLSCDRLSRNLQDFGLIEDLDRDLHLIREGVILSRASSSSGKLLHAMQVMIANVYLDNLSAEVKKGQRSKALAGLWPSFAPIGYKNVDLGSGQRGIAPDPARAPLLARCFRMFATGQHSIRSVAAWANSAGLRFRNSSRSISARALRAILQNSIYSGAFQWEGTLYTGKHQPIISREVWNQVQSLLKVSHRHRHRGVRNQKQLKAKGLMDGKCNTRINDAREGGDE